MWDFFMLLLAVQPALCHCESSEAVPGNLQDCHCEQSADKRGNLDKDHP
jgi:hypothetical protein